MRLHHPKKGVNSFQGGTIALPSLFLRTTQIFFNFMLILKKMHTYEHAFKLATITLVFVRMSFVLCVLRKTTILKH